LVVYYLVTLLLYYSSRYAGFVTDYTGFQERLDSGAGLKEAINSFGFPAIQPVLNLINLGLHEVFGVNNIGYYFFYCFFHALNAFLAFILFRKLLTIVKDQNAVVISLLSSLLFLCLPYCVEPIVWKVTINALFSTTLILTTLIGLLYYLEDPLPKYIILIMATSFLALLTFEYGIILFLLCTTVYAFVSRYIEIPVKRILVIIIPLFLLSIFYFLCVKLVTGDWSGHSGAATHLNFDLQLIGGNYFRFFMKYAFFFRYFSFDVKQKVFENIANHLFLYSSVIAIGAFLFGTFIFKKYRSSDLRKDTLHFSFLMFCVGLVPVVTMYHVWMFISENDRHGYLASIFFSLFVISLFFYFIKSRKASIITSCLLILIALVFQRKNINQWADSQEVYSSLLKDFRWYDAEEVYVMSVPDHFNGCYLFRTYEKDGSGLYDALKYSFGKTPKGRLIEVSQFNMNDKAEGFKPNRTSATEVSVEFLQWGNWWHRLGLGGVGYSNDKVKVNFDGQFAKVKLLNPAPNHVVIYMKDMKWYELK
jgi:hypothetical protein